MRERLQAGERRERILRAALDEFAEKGRDGATIKSVAEAAGVSEALLYKHFSGKDELFQAIEHYCSQGELHAGPDLAAQDLEPCTSTLVWGLHWLVSKVMLGGEEKFASHRSIRRLLLQSALTDGVFARSFVAHRSAVMIEKLEQSLSAAEAAGDVSKSTDPPRLRLWLAYHTATGVAAFHLDGEAPPIIDYGVPYREVVGPAVRFGLRGLGMPEAVIHAHYNAPAAALFSAR